MLQYFSKRCCGQIGSYSGLWVKRSGFKTWPGHCIVFLAKTLSSHGASLHLLLLTDFPFCWEEKYFFYSFISTVQLFEWFYEPTWCTAAMFITMCSRQYNLGYWTCHLVCVLSLNFSNLKRWQLVLCCDNDNNIVIWVILRTLSKWLLRYVQIVCLNKLILKWITKF